MRAACVALLAGVACHSHGPEGVPEPDEYILDCEEAATGGGFASDENYAAFVNAEAAQRVVIDSCQAPELLTPTAPLRADAPPEFSFNAVPASCASLHRPLRPHCGAFTGENYLLRIRRTAEAPPIYMAVLSVTRFTPDANIWRQALTDYAGETLTMTIERGVFFRGTLVEGPFVQSNIPVQVAP